jgi:hypothetical protein
MNRIDKMLSAVTSGRYKRRSIMLREASSKYCGSVTPRQGVRRLNNIVK